MSKNIVHQYFKKEEQGEKILLKINPLTLTGTELRISEKAVVATRDVEVSEDVVTELRSDGFEEVNPMEFNLYLSGLL
jgi:hypothetical protein